MNIFSKDTYERVLDDDHWGNRQLNQATLSVYDDSNSTPTEQNDGPSITLSMCAVVGGYIYRGTLYRAEKYVEEEETSTNP